MVKEYVDIDMVVMNGISKVNLKKKKKMKFCFWKHLVFSIFSCLVGWCYVSRNGNIFNPIKVVPIVARKLKSVVSPGSKLQLWTIRSSENTFHYFFFFSKIWSNKLLLYQIWYCTAHLHKFVHQLCNKKTDFIIAKNYEKK